MGGTVLKRRGIRQVENYCCAGKSYSNNCRFMKVYSNNVNATYNEGIGHFLVLWKGRAQAKI